eukprot:XP_025015592.1 jmjC domain-containing protein 7 isoform X3 [Ricinus communis]
MRFIERARETADKKMKNQNQIKSLWDEVRELSLSTTIERLDSPPTPLEFLRNYVSPNKPCIISNAISHWPALSLWPNHSYLTHSLSHSSVSLHLTPHGRADSLVPTPTNSLCFASAHVKSLPFPLAVNWVLNSQVGKSVAYLQQQNDCFRTEYFDALGSDCDGHIEWATEAFGCLPEAVNLWIGNHLSETSFHKDHYENLYAVVSGEKHFLLLPPTDVHRLYIRDYPAAQYSYSQEIGEFRLGVEEPVSRFNVQSRLERFFTWYDMQFDIKYAYFNFVQSIHYEHENSGSDVSECNLRDKSCIGASEVDAVESNKDNENE